MTYEELKANLRRKPGYLKKGNAVVAEAFNVSQAWAGNAKQDVKNERVTETHTETTTHTDTNFDWRDDPDFDNYCKHRGIDKDTITGVKYWQSGSGEARYSIATDPHKVAPANLDQFKTALLDDIRQQSEPVPAPLYAPNIISGNSENVAVYCLPDIHLGKVAPGWTLAEAEEGVLDVFNEFTGIAALHQPDHNLIPLGHDLLQIDSEHLSRAGTLHTTSGGTPVERTDPWPVLFRAGRRTGSSMIRMALKQAPTTVTIVPGNHSGRSEFALGEVWDAEYASESRVHIANTGEYHPTFEWGTTGLMMSHGDTVPWDKLPMFFAAVHAPLWGRTRYREVLTGHNHITRSRFFGVHEEFSGCTARTSPSLSRQDDWHGKFGYVSIPAAELIIYNKEKGVVGHYSRKILS